nr:FAD-dependent oxidoreductase [Candidatus Omnitrophota bacterium]
FEILGIALIKRRRLSRIFYKGKFFDYPLNFSSTITNLGVIDSSLILVSYLQSRFRNGKAIISFEDYVVKHFGRKLFKTFFKEYTEKVWGIPCSELSADWARQRIKGLSFISALKNSLTSGQDDNIRTLIKSFYYPVLGPGMMYEEAARAIKVAEGEVSLQKTVVKIMHDNNRMTGVTVRNKQGNLSVQAADQIISSMPLPELLLSLQPSAPQKILDAGKKLRFRNIVVVNLMCANADLFNDNWIYIHTPNIMLGRIQNYKNWSPLMVPDKRMTSLGLEYFCSDQDSLWNLSDGELVKLAREELRKIGFAVSVIDCFVYRASCAYPVYSIGYQEALRLIYEYLNQFSNLQIVGRAGRFSYDNMDSAIASGIAAAKNLTCL